MAREQLKIQELLSNIKTTKITVSNGRRLKEGYVHIQQLGLERNFNVHSGKIKM